MDESTINRVVEGHTASDIFTASEWILGLPRIKSTAIAVATGLGEVIRVTHAIKEWRAQGSPLLFLTGKNPEERTSEMLTSDRLVDAPYSISKADQANVVTQGVAMNSKEQAVWLVDEVRKRGLASIELHAPSYFMVRFYLTVVAAMHPGEKFLLVPHVTPYSPEYVIPDTGAMAVTMTAGEYARIEKYQEKGDVASLALLIDYLTWCWSTPEFQHLS